MPEERADAKWAGLTALVPSAEAEDAPGFSNAHFLGSYGGVYNGLAPNLLTGNIACR